MGLFADAGGKPAVGILTLADAARGSHEQVARSGVSRFIDRYAGCPKRLDPLVDAQVEGQLQRDCCVVNDLMDHFSAHIGWQRAKHPFPRSPSEDMGEDKSVSFSTNCKESLQLKVRQRRKTCSMNCLIGYCTTACTPAGSSSGRISILSVAPGLRWVRTVLFMRALSCWM